MNIYNRINGWTKIKIQRKKVNTAAHLDYDTAREYSWYLKKEEKYKKKNNNKNMKTLRYWKKISLNPWDMFLAKSTSKDKNIFS